jgi:hypothetical protein
MSREDDIRRDDEMEPMVAEALGALRSLPRPEPPPSARERARAAFLRGDAPASGDEDGDTVPGTAGAGGGVVPMDPALTRRGWRRAFTYVMPLAAVFVALAVFVGIYGSQPDMEWRVADVVNPAGVISEQDVAVGAVIGGGFLATGDSSEVEVQLGETLRLRLTPGTRIELPDPPGRWVGRQRELALTDGEVFGTTAGRSLGFALAFVTPELNARLTGTTFAVWRDASGSCVCLWTGGVDVAAHGEEIVSVPVKQRYMVYKDGRREIQDIDDRERMKLGMMQDGGMPPPPGTGSE